MGLKAAETAVTYFEKGFNCSQAVLAAFGPQLGLDGETALKLAAGFGSGMGRMGEICGAVTGAFMVIGLKHGTVVADGEAKEDSYRLVREFSGRFKGRMGSMKCRELLGYDIGSAEEIDPAEAKKLRETVCKQCVRDAAEIIGEMLIKGGFINDFSSAENFCGKKARF